MKLIRRKFTVIFDRDALPLLVYGENYFDFKEELDETKQLIYGQAS